MERSEKTLGIDDLLGQPISEKSGEGTVTRYYEVPGRGAERRVAEAMEASGVDVTLVETPNDFLKACQKVPVATMEHILNDVEKSDPHMASLWRAGRRILARRKKR